MPILTVTGLNTYVNSLLEENEFLNDITLQAEISNYKNHRSGHRYMTLKDEESSISAVMFAGNASRIRFPLEDGMRVIVRGRAALYAKTGQYQLYISDIRPDGIGALSMAFENLKKRLAAEGLFDREHKKPLPFLPERIGVITSDTGAAVKDICEVLARRYPIGEIILCPVLVQGINAAPELTAAIEKFDRLKCADVIIIGRGGGSAEELWAFNDEKLARAIYKCSIPVVSGVGHQIDTTICDYAADAAAPTPSAAAEIISPDEGFLESTLSDCGRKLVSVMNNILIRNRLHLESLSKAFVLSKGKNITAQRMIRLEMLSNALNSQYKLYLQSSAGRLSALAAKFDALSPLKVLSRGYAAASKDGQIISSVKDIGINDRINVRLSDGSLECTVNERVDTDGKA